MAEIERLTGLDFGNLRHHDTFADAPEAIRRRARPLQRFEQIHLGAAKAQPIY